MAAASDLTTVNGEAADAMAGTGDVECVVPSILKMPASWPSSAPVLVTEEIHESKTESSHCHCYERKETRKIREPLRHDRAEVRIQRQKKRHRSRRTDELTPANLS